MAHLNQMMFVDWVKIKFPKKFRNTRVLEIGSYNVNGTVRSLFEGCDYIGIDLCPGNCVDEICSGHVYTDDLKFDVIISCETFEHNMFWVETLFNMIKLSRRNGLIIMTCATTGRAEHGTARTCPDQSLSSSVYGNYYKNLTQQDIEAVCNPYDHFYDHFFSTLNEDLYFYGLK